MDRAKTVACLIAALLLTACSRSERIVVGSKNFTEQVLLGEIIAQQLERRLQVGVDRKLNLGGTLLTHEALKGGSIDLYPEYTGTALTAVLRQPAAGTPAEVRERVASEYQRQWKLRWLAPFGFNNTFAMVVRRDPGISTLSAAASSGKRWRLGAGYEFAQRLDGLKGLLKTYPLQLEGAPLTMDLGLLYSALTSGKVDMVAASSTDGMLSVLDVTVLEDDKHYFPPYECSVVVREQTLDRVPGLRTALEELSGQLSDTVMRKLNHAVDGDHKPVREVAAGFLTSIRRSAQ